MLIPRFDSISFPVANTLLVTYISSSENGPWYISSSENGPCSGIDVWAELCSVNNVREAQDVHSYEVKATSAQSVQAVHRVHFAASAQRNCSQMTRKRVNSQIRDYHF
eukprot:gene27386-biopygen10623